MDSSTVTDPAARAFLAIFTPDRLVNKAFYKRVPEDKLDYRMVDTPTRKSDSPRESIAHQIYVTKKYIYAAKHGVLEFDGVVDGPLENAEQLGKEQLLKALEQTEAELVALLTEPDIATRTVRVPWSNNPVSVTSMLYALNSHEILHQGWNLALMDHLDIERFPEFKALWG